MPAGFLVDAPWRTGQGIAYESFRDYVKRGWFERVIRVVFRRPAPNVPASSTTDWKACLLSVQHIMRYDVHVGGTAALTERGYIHYLRFGSPAQVAVYSDAMPKWLRRVPLNAPIKSRNTSLFSDQSLGLVNDDKDLSDTLPWDWPLKISTPERAVMEVMDDLPCHESFHNLDMVFQGLTHLRPKLLTELLRSCRKIKVKRLFFTFADRYDHAWRKYVDPEEFDLGRGDRALLKGGKMHRRYRIMVPEEFVMIEDDYGA